MTTRGSDGREARAIEREFGVRVGTRIRLGAWGYASSAAQLNHRTLLVLETQTTQKRPCANILKLWPYSEDNPGVLIILVHVVGVGSGGGQDIEARLASFVASRLCDELPESFVCYRLEIDDSDALHGEVEELRRQIRASETAEY